MYHCTVSDVIFWKTPVFFMQWKWILLQDLTGTLQPRARVFSLFSWPNVPLLCPYAPAPPLGVGIKQWCCLTSVCLSHTSWIFMEPTATESKVYWGTADAGCVWAGAGPHCAQGQGHLAWLPTQFVVVDFSCVILKYWCASHIVDRLFKWQSLLSVL